jgi:crotonobetainyl-CoA:carnitine CoA-transferase CaiB-like acyl-CoA transferase
LLEDARFNSAVERVRNRHVVTDTLNDITRAKPTDWWIENLEKNKIGCGRINTLQEVFDDPQVTAREMVIEMEHPATGGRKAKVIASPLKLSGTPVSYRRTAPLLGQHTDEVLGEYLGMSGDDVASLREKGVV